MIILRNHPVLPVNVDFIRFRTPRFSVSHPFSIIMHAYLSQGSNQVVIFTAPSSPFFLWPSNSTLKFDRHMAGSKERDDNNQAAAWWSILLWIADVLVLPCKPIIFPPFSPCPPTVTGTILCPPDGDANRRLRLFLQDGIPTGPTLLLLDLPLAPCQFAGAARITLECESGDAGPLLVEPVWAVSCDGRRAGFGTRRPAPTEAEVRALEAMRPVSAGAGRGVGGFTYVRGTFERVVGSADSESYHLVGPAGFFGAHDLSFFFLRVRL